MSQLPSFIPCIHVVFVTKISLRCFNPMAFLVHLIACSLILLVTALFTWVFRLVLVFFLEVLFALLLYAGGVQILFAFFLWGSLFMSRGLLTIHDNFYDLWAVHVNHWEFKFPEVMTSHKGQKVHTGHCLYRNSNSNQDHEIGNTKNGFP